VSGTRCFIGLALDATAREWMVAARTRVIAEAPEWADEKWVKESNLHVTVRFLGNIADQDLPMLIERLGCELRDVPRFTLGVLGVVAKPNRRRCRMLWTSCTDSSGGFSALNAAINVACSAEGVPGDERPQTPHVTLCRARRNKTIPSGVLERVNASLESARLAMSEPSVSLFTSRLAPRGPEYEAIATWCLRGE